MCYKIDLIGRTKAKNIRMKQNIIISLRIFPSKILNIDTREASVNMTTM